MVLWGYIYKDYYGKSNIMNKSKGKILFLRARTGWRDPSPHLAFAYLGKIAKDAGWEVLIENLHA